LSGSEKFQISENIVTEFSTDTEPLWTVEDVAGYLRLEPETIRVMAREEKIPAIKVGRVWRFNKNSLKAWLMQQEA